MSALYPCSLVVRLRQSQLQLFYSCNNTLTTLYWENQKNDTKNPLIYPVPVSNTDISGGFFLIRAGRVKEKPNI